MPESTNEVWNSLEVVKLLVSLLTPLLILGLTFWINYRIKKIDQRWKRDESIAQKRVDLYDDIGIKANKLFAYVTYVGTWKETSPREILDLKRELDTTMHTYKPWFSVDFTKRYEAFISSIFNEYQGHGKDAKIRTTLLDREELYPKQWNTEWNNLISDEVNREASEKYHALLHGIANELNLQKWTSENA